MGGRKRGVVWGIIPFLGHSSPIISPPSPLPLPDPLLPPLALSPPQSRSCTGNSLWGYPFSRPHTSVLL